jgi:beta-galactosidase
MAWRQCRSDLHVEFIRWRYDRIKERCDTMVTTNYQPFFAKHTDYFKVSEILDVPGHNYYPCGAPHELIVQVDFTRGVKGSCLVLEMRTGAPYYEQATRPGMMRLWTYQALAHGAFGINYFRWRTCRFGQEQYWHGILPHSGKPKRLYDEFTSMAHELQDVADKIVKRKVKAEVALVYSYPSRLALDEKLPGYEFNYPATLHGWHKALMRANVAVDIVPPYAELGKYKLVLAPLCYVLMEDEAENMRRFVERGGALLTTYRSSVVDEHNVIYDVALPANLVDVFGVEVAEYDSPPGPLLITGLSEKISANSWCDSIELCGAEPVAVLDEGIFAGQPALTTNRHVAGTAVYLGVDLDTHGLDVVTRFLLDTAQGERRPVTPDGVQVQRLEGDDGPVVIALNFTNAGTEFDLEGKWKDIISGDEFDRLVSVGPRDVRVLEMA